MSKINPRNSESFRITDNLGQQMIMLLDIWERDVVKKVGSARSDLDMAAALGKVNQFTKMTPLLAEYRLKHDHLLYIRDLIGSFIDRLEKIAAMAQDDEGHTRLTTLSRQVSEDLIRVEYYSGSQGAAIPDNPTDVHPKESDESDE